MVEVGAWWQNHGAACPALCFDLQPDVLVPNPPYFAQSSVLVEDQQDHFGSTFIFISTTALCSVLTVVNYLCFFLFLPIYFLVCTTLPDCVLKLQHVFVNLYTVHVKRVPYFCAAQSSMPCILWRELVPQKWGQGH